MGYSFYAENTGIQVIPTNSWSIGSMLKETNPENERLLITEAPLTVPVLSTGVVALRLCLGKEGRL